MLQYGYTFDINSGIWIKASYDELKYSDGDEVEYGIEQVLKTVQDLSTLSSELKSYCIDWPTTYHFSEKRANIVRPFQDSLFGADVLEIGSGCGAITRFLGEICSNVVALEGSPRRAAITKLRTRDLDNIEVVCDKFEDFNTDRKFDFVTLIGVLEYASSFSSSLTPQVDMIDRVKRFLKPDGKLIIAIENQLGLKYFSGAPEDHYGKPMYGIENHYKPFEARTFGRLALQKLLTQAGFSHTKFMVPYPDYKLPISIVTEEGFDNCNFDATPFAVNSVDADGQPFHYNFDLKSTYKTVIENGLGVDLANSFLICATLNQITDDTDLTLAFHYSTSRRSGFCKQTKFKEMANSQIIVEKDSLTQEKVVLFDLPIEISRNTKFDYVFGCSLSEKLFEMLKFKYWDIDDVVKFIEEYLDIILSFHVQKVERRHFNLCKLKVEGKFFDATFDNIIIRPDGTPVLIDQEWRLKDDLNLGYLLFRCLISFLDKYRIDWKNYTGKVVLSRADFIKEIYLKIDDDFDAELLNNYLNYELEIQGFILDRQTINFDTQNWFDAIPVNNYSKDEIISKLQGELQASEDLCVNLNSIISDKRLEIDELNLQLDCERQFIDEYKGKTTDEILSLSRELADCNLEVANLYLSKSWLITKPLRKMRKLWGK